MLSPTPVQQRRIAPISVVDSLDHVEALLLEHWTEVARNKSVMVLKPNREAYALMERAGMLIALGAFDGDEMVGYSVSTVQPHLHYADLTYAQNDVVFVRQSHRSGTLGLRLIQETERVARERGCGMVMWHAKPDTSLAKLLPLMGYGVQDVIYGRALSAEGA